MKKKKPHLRIKNIYKRIGKKEILKDVSLEVFPGEIFGFLGPNGAGKTTTMKCVMGLIQPDKGDISVFGKSVQKDIDVRKRIGFMPENTYLYTFLTGEEFLRFNARFFNLSEKKMKKNIKEVLEKVDMYEHRHRKLSTYSKGMLQRIGIAQSLVHDPEILFLDEPMSGLDPIGRKIIKDIVNDLAKKGVTVMLNTHVLSDVKDICDRFCIMHLGKIYVVDEVKKVKGNMEDYFVKTIKSIR